MRILNLQRVLLLLAGVTVLAVLAAGCGGGSDGGGGERLSKAEFVTKADAICTDFKAKGEKLKLDLPAGFDPTSASATEEQLDKFGDYIDDNVKLFRTEIDELRDLNPPVDVEDDFNKAVSLLEETADEGEDAAGAAHDADRDKLKEKLAESEKHSNEANTLAKKLGLTVCGSS